MRKSLIFMVALLVAAALAAPAWAAGYKAEYKMSIRTSETSPWGAGAQKFADLVREKTGGKINIKCYFNGSLFADDQTKEFMMLKQGVADFALGSTINWSPQIRSLNLFSLPFLFPSYEALDRVKQGAAGQKLIAEIAKFNVLTLAWGENGYRELTNRIKPVVTPADLDGMKVRAVGSPIFKDTFAALGANPVLMNWGDALTAFQQGTVDGQENPVNVIIIPYKIYQYHKYITIWHYTIDPLVLGVNQDTFKSFAPADQKIVQQAADEAMAWQLDQARTGLTGDMASLNKLKAEGMEVTVLTPAQMKAFKDKCKPVWDKWAPQIGDEIVKAALAEIDKTGK
ncbi:MAG: DctP family TRAP transporter solute-binding subunit [Pseudomonadota bacterium]